MSLDITFSVSIDTDRTTLTLDDSTVYGGSNPTRANLRVFFSAFKMAYDNTATALTVTSDTSDPETVAQWEYDYTADGWYKHYYVAIPLYSGAVTYAQYAAVADSTTDIVYRSLSAGNIGHALSNTTYWEVITDPAALANNKDQSNESTNINSLVYQRIFTSNGQYAYANLIRSNCMCTDCDEEALMQEYAIFSIWLNGAIACDERTEVLSGELICRKIESRFIDCV